MDRTIFLSLIKKTAVYFFCLLSLFWAIALGDGKQHIVDFWGASQTMSLYIAFRYLLPQRRKVPSSAKTAWFFLLVYLTVRTVFSIDIGLSLYATLRYFEAYVIFSVFYEYGTDWLEKKLLVIINITAALLSVVVVVSFFNYKIPFAVSPMNLFLNTYGHNQAVNLILIALPVAYFQKNVFFRLFFLAVLMVGLIFSLSRIAYLMAAAFFIAEYLRKSINGKATFIKTATAISAISMAASGAVALSGSTSLNLLLKINKQPIIENNRFLYMKQAVDAFQDSILFGHGPGTFSILSKKYQPYSMSYSWFSHSFPLEILSELGFVGFIMVITIIAPIVLRAFYENIYLHKNISQKALSWIVIILFIYSSVEYTLNYLIMWLFFWAAAGLLASRKQYPGRTTPQQNHIYG
jgi:hypothetical protein